MGLKVIMTKRAHLQLDSDRYIRNEHCDDSNKEEHKMLEHHNEDKLKYKDHLKY